MPRIGTILFHSYLTWYTGSDTSSITSLPYPDTKYHQIAYFNSTKIKLYWISLNWMVYEKDNHIYNEKSFLIFWNRSIAWWPISYCQFWMLFTTVLLPIFYIDHLIYIHVEFVTLFWLIPHKHLYFYKIKTVSRI